MMNPLAKHQIREIMLKKESEVTMVDALVKLTNAQVTSAGGGGGRAAGKACARCRVVRAGARCAHTCARGVDRGREGASRGRT
jgi:hypothetical protein